MDLFIGAKLIKAEPMGRGDFNAKFNGAEAPSPDMMQEAGYHVQYPDGYHSWSPKDVFENAYRKVTYGEVEMFRDIDSETCESEKSEDSDTN